MDGTRFKVLTVEEASLLENTPHNPPQYSDTFSEEDFEKEWWLVCDRLASLLNTMGQPLSLDGSQGDYALPETRARDRWIYVTFLSTRFWCPEFPIAVASFLKKIEFDYRVACLAELTEAADPVFEKPLVYLVISADTIMGHAKRHYFNADGRLVEEPANDVLSCFGFPDSLVSST